MSLRNPLLLLTLCLVAPALASAKPKKKAAAPKDAPNTFYVLIGPGGSADEAQAGLKKLAAADLSFVQLSKGYPQVLVSDSVVGLKPGFHIVVFGFCKDGAKANQIAKAMQQVSPGTYVRRVTGTYDGQCPALQGEQWLLSTSTLKCEGKEPVTTTRVTVLRNGKQVAEETFSGECNESHSLTAQEEVIGSRTMLLVTDRQKAWRTSSADDAHPEEVDAETYELWSLENGALKQVLRAPMADDAPVFETPGDDWKHLKFSQQGWSGTRSYEYTWNPSKAAYENTTPREQAEENIEMDQEGD